METMIVTKILTSFSLGYLFSLEDKALCPKLTFSEWRVCLYDQALVYYCLHSKAHAWLNDAILNVSAWAVFCYWVCIG